MCLNYNVTSTNLFYDEMTFVHVSVKSLKMSLKVVILKGSYNHLFVGNIITQTEGLQVSCEWKEWVGLGTKMISRKNKLKKKRL